VAACPRLEAVDKSHCVATGDRKLAALAAAAGLRELVMDKCLGITDVGLAKVSVWCSGVERLSIKWCRKISHIGSVLLAKLSSAEVSLGWGPAGGGAPIPPPPLGSERDQRDGSTGEER
jgi:hypothetical protein